MRRRELTGVTLPVTASALTFSPDGRLLATAAQAVTAP